MLPAGRDFPASSRSFQGFSPLPKALGRVDTALREGPGVGLKRKQEVAKFTLSYWHRQGLWRSLSGQKLDGIQRDAHGHRRTGLGVDVRHSEG